MKLLILLGVVLCYTSGSLANSRNCAKGPEYWCRDLATAKACGAVRHCQQTVWNTKENSIPSTSNHETADMLCSILVQASTKLLADSSMDIKSITTYLRSDCAKLPKENNLVQQCEMAVDTYLSDIIRHIQTGTESTKICPIVHGHITPSAFIPKPKSNELTSNATCVLCEFIIHVVESMASANASEQELIKIFEKVCTEMPKVLQGECKDFVDEYGPDLIELLVREVDPAKACELIKICPKPKNVAFLTKPNMQTCGLCDYISTYITAGHPIEKICTHFSTDNGIKQQCETLVHLYKPNICPQLPLCHDDVVEQPVKTEVNSVECSLCQFIVRYVDTAIENNKTEAAIEAALEKVCGILPHTLNASCVQFVEEYGAILVQLIEKYGTPDKVCDAIKFCKNGTEEVAPPTPVPVNTIECTLCEYAVGYVEKTLGANRSAAAVEALLDKACNVLPPSVRSNCTSFVTKYGPIIALLLAKNESAEQVCDFIKVCNNGTEEVAPRKINTVLKVEQSPDNSVECSLCKYIVGYVDTVIQNNKSEAAIEHALEKVCTILPHALNASCVEFVKSYGPVLVQLIEQYGSPDKVCAAIQFCKNGTQTVAPPKPAPVNTIECTLCEYAVGYAEKTLGANRSAAAIEALLDKACNVLPPSVRGNCTSFVTKYGPIIALLLAKNQSAEQVCDFLKVCNNGTQEIAPSKPIITIEIKESPDNSAECALCKYIVGYVDTVVQNNKSEAAIEAALEKVCTILPHTLNASCVSFVENFGPILVQLIEKYGTPDQVCDAIKFCKNGTEEVAPPKPASVNTIECTLCEYAVGYAEKTLGANRSAAAIEALLDKACNVLPPSVRGNCTSFVTKYGPIIALLLAKNESAEQVCDFLKVCNNGTQEIAPSKPISKIEIQESSDNSAECALCKYIVGYVDTVIQNNKSEAAIEAALEKVCTILPHALNASCVSFVETFGPILVQLIEKYGSPDQVCDAIKFCKNGSEEVVPPKPVPVNTIECTLCEYAVGYVEKTLGANRSAAAVEALLDKACNVLPPSVRGNCTSFVTKYGPIIALLLAKNESAEQVCDFIKVCNNGTQQIAPSKPIITIEIIETPDNSAECSLCKYIVGYVDTVVQNNKSEAAIEAALEKVCTILPHALNASCVSFVENFGPILVQLIEKYGSPDQVCDAIKFCKNGTEEVAPPKPAPVNTIECTLCEYAVGYAEKTLGANRSAAAIEALLDKACNVLPPSVRGNCTSFVTKYGPIIALLLAKNQSAEQVCDFLKVCNNGTQEITPVNPVNTLKIEESPDNSAECSLCKYIVGYVDTVVQNNKSEAAIEAALEKVCTILPHALNASCVQFVESFGPILVQLIEKYGTPDQVCDAIKFCKNGTEEVAPPKPAPVNTIECTLCEYAVGYAEKTLGANRSAAAIEALLDKACNVLPPSVRGNCTSFVTKYGPIIALLLAKNESAEQVCDFLKVCNNGTQEIVAQAAVEVLKVKESPDNSIECSLCKYIVGYVDTVIQNNKSEAAIESALEKVCTIIPHELKKKCDDFVKTYGPLLVQLIEEYSTPDAVCKALKMCDKATQEIEAVPVAKSVEAGPECTLCKYVVGYVDAVIQTNKSEAAIDSALEKVCSILPHKLNASCVQFVDTFGPVLVEYIAKYATADEVCQALKMCHNGTEEIPSESDISSKSKSSSVGSPQCSLCKLIVSYIDVIIQNNKSEAAIEAALEKICTIVPHADKDKCLEFVDTYGTKIVKLLEEFSSPEVVCLVLGMCIKNKQEIESLPGAKPVEAGPECTLCKYVVGYVDAVIQTNKSEAAIDSALEKVCSILPHKLNASCVQFVDTFGPVLVEYIAKYATADEVCQALKMCHNGTEVVKPVPREIVKPKTNVKGAAECTLCKYVVSYINLLLESNATEQEIEKGLKVVCSLLPKDMEKSCDTFVTTYGPIIPQLIAELDDPNVVCELIGACKKTSDKRIMVPSLKTKALKSLPCNLCQYLVNYLDAIIQSNATEVDFEKALEKACKILPETKLVSECDSIVERYSNDLIKFLVEFGDPKKVCQELGICDK